MNSSYKDRFEWKIRPIQAKDIPGLAEELRRSLDGLSLDLRREFRAIRESVNPSASVRTLVAVTGGGGGGGGGAIISGLQTGTVSVGTTTTTITVSPTISNYLILFECRNSSNEQIGCDFSNKTSGSFQATAAESATLIYALLPL